MKKYLLLFSGLFITSFLVAQNGFNYQAVIRDAAGVILSNQSISMRIGMVQENISAAPIYQETHTVLTNNYGVVSLRIGTGTVTLGDFKSIDWRKPSFTKVELDVTGGNNYKLIGTTQLGTVPTALYAESSGNDFGLNVKQFGAIGDNSNDDTAAIQAAIDSAAVMANRVVFPAGNYKTMGTLVVPNGVMLVGEGTGSNPLSGPFNGSAIRYYGSETALVFEGNNAGIRDIVVVDRSGGSAEAGIKIIASGRSVESIRFFNILIFGFVGGTSLKLEAKNSGGIAYASFYNVRIRNTKIGIHIVEDASSFVNSNSWFHGEISGGAFDYCLKVDGGNNNQFYGTVMEPPSSKLGHIVVTTGEIQGHNIRVEGTSQAATTPLIDFQTGTYDSFLSGTYAGGLTLDRGNNTILLRSGKATKFINSSQNQFENASFLGYDGITIPGWKITGNPEIEILDADLSPHHKVLKLKTSGLTTLSPDERSNPALGNAPYFRQLNFGMYVKTDQQNSVALTSNVPNGVVTSQYHSGDNTWQFVGMTAAVDPTTSIQSQLIITSPSTVYLTMPALTFGNQIPDLSPKPITTAGGQIQGMLTTRLVSTPFTPFQGSLLLPQEGNVFEINGSKNIKRINHLEPDHFPKGTVISLLFNKLGSTVFKNNKLLLKSEYISVKNGSLELISLGDGTWREMDRNN
ncbi:MAG: glycosyl hydrolase family 28-related protein [Saprospiraceae bacterium]